jgi:thiosulfate/3-mercaptopyruvate sulfurtransferase
VKYQFVDCRYELGKPERGQELYREGHVPGASFLDLDADLSDMSRAPGEGRHPLPTAEAFAASAGRAGIGPGVFVVAYDQGRTGGAARLWWLLQHFGHQDVAVLDGGIGAWLGPLAAGDEDIVSAEFVPNERSGDTASADELLERIQHPEVIVLDARPPERYRGEVEPLDPVAGHIPGARNLPFSEVDPLLPELLHAQELIVYCGSGVTACVPLLALHRAGRRDARLYPGSWSEWSRRGLPVERG